MANDIVHKCKALEGNRIQIVLVCPKGNTL